MHSGINGFNFIAMKRIVHILLVENDVLSQLEVTRALEKRNILHFLTVVKNGDEALEVLSNSNHYRSGKPDVIFVDLNIPDLNGLDMLSAIHANPRWKDIKIFMLTSSDRPLDRNKAFELGASGFFTKPLSLENPSTSDAFNLMIDLMNF